MAWAFAIIAGMRCSRSHVLVAATLTVLGSTLSACGLVGGSGAPTPSAMASAPGSTHASAGASTRVSTGSSAGGSPPSAGESSGGASASGPASPAVTVDPNDPTGVAASLGVTLVDAGDAGMVSNGLITFRSPSGRIRCMVSDLPDAFARCDVTDATFTPPKKPAECALDWGSGVTVSPGRRAQFVCAGDTVDNGPTLAYGSAVIVGDLICISRTDGVTCRTATTALHGFRIARESYSLF